MKNNIIAHKEQNDIRGEKTNETIKHRALLQSQLVGIIFSNSNLSIFSFRYFILEY